MEQDDQADALGKAALKAYQDSWHLILDSDLGTKGPVTVVIPGYALKRIRQRDLDESEVLQALASNSSSHRRGNTGGRYEVPGETLGGRVRVIYERPNDDIVLVITTYKESE